jgi:hypothetical protein
MAAANSTDLYLFGGWANDEGELTELLLSIASDPTVLRSRPDHRTLTGLLLNDLYHLDGRTLQWTAISPAATAGPWPAERWAHGLAWAGGRLYLFGGWGNGNGELLFT